MCNDLSVFGESKISLIATNGCANRQIYMMRQAILISLNQMRNRGILLSFLIRKFFGSVIVLT